MHCTSLPSYLSILRKPDFSPHVPYSWGFTIYHASPPGLEQDARFTEGVRRLNEWMRWMVRNRRYTDEDLRLWSYRPELMSQPHEHDIWDEVAARMWNEVVEEYLEADQVDATVLGKEDFPRRRGLRGLGRRDQRRRRH
ncbi:hypothetical protein PG999_012105 [Apiospora kogelbergensis]|uniref:Uncharacterized protein n=1 Tax=Apiospora kogelbergensis TaxID=1337665 RepID=A0AAW0QHB5_9PEZI